MNLTDKETAAQRARDLHMLAFLLDNSDRLEGQEFTSFDDMLKRLSSGRMAVLSKAQRGMASAICRKLSPSGEGWDDDGLTPAERNKNVPRGKEVPTPAVLQNLPKKPPTKRVSE